MRHPSINEPVKPEDIGIGFYWAANTDQGLIFAFKVNYQHISTDGTRGFVVWGLSFYKNKLAYRTLGLELDSWLSRQSSKARYYRDCDRTTKWEDPSFPKSGL